MPRALLLLLLTLPFPAVYFASGAGHALADGTVVDASGQPLPGVTVTALRPDGVVGHSVVTDTDGRFAFEALPAGTYTLRARRIGFQETALQGWDPSGPQVTLTLPAQPDVFGQMPSSAFLGLLSDGEEKRAFVLDCAGCHQFDQRIVAPGGALRSHASWVARIQQMIAMAGGASSFPIISPSRDPEATATWLVNHLGDETDPLPTFTPPPPMTGADAAFSVVEYDIPAGGDLPHDLLPDGQGRLVITGMMTNRMYVLDPTTGTFSTVPTPAVGPRALDIGPDGTWWVALGGSNTVGAYRQGAWTTYPIGMYPHDVVLDGQGRLWFNGHFTVNPERMGYLDTTTGQVHTLTVPSPPMPDGGSTIPYGMRVDQDGLVWMTELRGNRLVRFDPAAEAFTLYDLPTTVSGPRRLAVASDGSLWIPEFAANKLARFDHDTETFQEWALPLPDALPYIARVDPADGSVWVATGAADAVLRFDPAAETWAVHRLPTPKALVRHMEPNPGGGMWLAYGNSPATDPKVALVRRLADPTGTETGAVPDPLRFRVFPNPSSGAARAAFVLPRAGEVRLTVLDAQGRTIATLAAGARAAGPHEVALDTRALRTGLYLVRLEAGAVSVARGLVLAK